MIKSNENSLIHLLAATCDHIKDNLIRDRKFYMLNNVSVTCLYFLCALSVAWCICMNVNDWLTQEYYDLLKEVSLSKVYDLYRFNKSVWLISI